MRKSTKLLVLLSIFAVGFLLGGLTIINVKAISDINYTFINNELYNEINPPYDTFNLENETVISEIYNATYSFNEELGQLGTDIGFVDGVTLYDGACEIVSDWQSHDEVLRFQDDVTAFEDPQFFHFEIQSTSGTREFYIGTNDVTEYWELFYFEDDHTFIIQLRIIGGFLDYRDNGGSWQEVQAVTNDVFYHVKVIWRADNTFDIWVNEILKVDNVGTNNNMISGIDIFCIRCYGDSTDYVYLDAYGDPDNDAYYEIGDNLEPLIIKTNNMTVSADEFAFDENGVQYDTGVYSANGWIGDESGDTYLFVDEVQTYDRRFRMLDDDETPNQIEKYFNSVGGIINLTFRITYLTMNNLDSFFTIGVYAPDLSIVNLRITYSGGFNVLSYFDGESYNPLRNIERTVTLNRNLTIGLKNNTCYLTYEDENTEISHYSFDKLNDDDRLEKVLVKSQQDDSSSYQGIHIDYIASYVNYSEVNDDFGVNFYALDVPYWKSTWYNLLEIDGTGFFSIGAFSGTSFYSLRSFKDRTGSFVYNVYNQSFLLYSPYVAIMTNQSFTISKINIYGVNMTDGTNTFIPEFYYGSVNIDESHFYVDSNNKLQFDLIVNDNNTEWMELRFALLTRTTENRSLSFKSNINGVSKGYVHLAYWGFETTDIYFPYYERTTTSYLPQEFVIFTLSIIISDLDITWYDNCNGYITNLKLIHTPEGVGKDISLLISISVLVGVIIPLIILLAPTLAISIRFGKKAILPIFLLMSLVCVATDLIPIWIFFVIILGSGALLFAQRNRRDVL